MRLRLQIEDSADIVALDSLTDLTPTRLFEAFLTIGYVLSEKAMKKMPDDIASKIKKNEPLNDDDELIIEFDAYPTMEDFRDRQIAKQQQEQEARNMTRVTYDHQKERTA